MKALVTGGAGFIGSHLTDELIANGAEVHIIDNLSTGLKQNLQPSAKLYIDDLRSDTCYELIKRIKPDFVFHLAAQVDVQRSIMDPNFDATININGTIRLVAACKQAGVKKMIFASSSAVYGESNQKRISEDSDPAPISYYGLSKCVAENYIRLYHQLNSFNYSILRFSNVFGPRQTANGEGGVIAIFMNRVKNGLPLTVHGSGNQTRDFIFVKDVARANIAAIRHGDHETINVSTGLRTSINNLVHMIKMIHGSSVEVIYGPERSGDIFDSCLDNTKAEQILGWRPKGSLFEGISQTYRANSP